MLSPTNSMPHWIIRALSRSTPNCALGGRCKAASIFFVTFLKSNVGWLLAENTFSNVSSLNSTSRRSPLIARAVYRRRANMTPTRKAIASEPRGASRVNRAS
jgi:hypothetical protein